MSRASASLQALLLLLALLPQAARALACGEGLANPVTLENCRTDPAGWSSDWQADRTRFVYDTRVLAGYSSSTSVNAGEEISLYIRSPQSPPGFSIRFYRLGWYGGKGGRLVAEAPNLSSPAQPECHWQDAGTVNAYFTCSNWHVSYTLSVPRSWTSGIYLAAIRSHAVPGPAVGKGAQAWAHDVIFVVRDDQRRADFVYQQPVATEQAYNSYNYGPSLYNTRTLAGHAVPVAKASFERPHDALDNLQFYRFELPFISWLESEGFDTVYTTDIDTHERSVPFADSYRAFILSGHSEYRTRRMYDAVQSARDRGVHLGFFGGDIIYWQMRLEEEQAPRGDATHRIADRVMVVFRHPYPPDAEGRGDPNPDPSLQTIYWRDFPLLRDEESLVGVHFTHPLDCMEHSAAWANAGAVDDEGRQTAPRLESAPQSLVVADAAAWPFEGTGLDSGDQIEHVYGQEADSAEPPFGAARCGRSTADPPPRPPAYRVGSWHVLASSPFEHVSARRPGPIVRAPTIAPVNSVIYQACSGAWVFAAGDIMWGNTLAPSLMLGQNYTSSHLQQLTRNVLDVFSGHKSVPAGGACSGSAPAQVPQSGLDVLFE